MLRRQLREASGRLVFLDFMQELSSVDEWTSGRVDEWTSGRVDERTSDVHGALDTIKTQNGDHVNKLVFTFHFCPSARTLSGSGWAVLVHLSAPTAVARSLPRPSTPAPQLPVAPTRPPSLQPHCRRCVSRYGRVAPLGPLRRDGYGSPTLGASGSFSPAKASTLRRIAVDIHMPAPSNRSTWVTTRSIKPRDFASTRTLNVPQTSRPAACAIRRACPSSSRTVHSACSSAKASTASSPAPRSTFSH